MPLKAKETQARVYKNLVHISVSVKMMYIVTVHLAVLINSASVNSSRKDCFLLLSLIHICEKDTVLLQNQDNKRTERWRT